MSKLYIFGIGGTGCRVMKSLTMLLAAGVKCDADTIVPYTMSEELYKKHPDKIRYELFPGADHGMSYIVDKARYQNILKEFLSK